MENARLINEQREALEQQTATAEVLQVINSSPGNLAPVFDAILEKAHNLCDVAVGSLSIYLNGVVHTAAARGFSAEYQALLRRPYPAIGSHQALMRGGPSIQTPDFRTVPVSPVMASSLDHLERMKLRTGLWVPLRKDGTALGCISAYRDKVQPFSEKEIALLENFAAQAVIAMENARLLTEQQEALERQTATAEVLQVINASPGNLVPVFDAILEKAHNLCSADHGSFYITDGEAFRAVAVRGMPDAFADLIRQPFRLSPNHPVRQLIAGSPFAVVHDASEVDDPIIQGSLRLAGMHSALFVPLQKDKLLLGYIVASSPERRAYTDKQVALLQNFAAQAVIAMENARLITEQREALEQQTATAEVLQVINASPGDLAPVFDAMLQKATDLCAAAFGILWTFDGEHYHAVAFRNVPPAYSEFLRDPPPATPLTPLGRIAAGEAFAQIADMADEIFAAGGPLFHRAVELAGFRTIVGVPLRKDAILLGAITIYRQEVRPFSDKQIALLQSFAAQAVIAIENATPPH